MCNRRLFHVSRQQRFTRGKRLIMADQFAANGFGYHYEVHPDVTPVYLTGFPDVYYYFFLSGSLRTP